MSGPFKRFGINRAAVLEGAIGGLGTSPTSMKPQISAKAENLRFSLYGAHKALLASIELPHYGNVWYTVKHSRTPPALAGRGRETVFLLCKGLSVFAFLTERPFPGLLWRSEIGDR